MNLNGDAFCRCVAVVTSHNRDLVPLEHIQSAQVIVGTSCAGTGLDISGVGHIIVVGLPFSIEQLLQWAGRCRSNGTVAVLVPWFQMKKGDEMTSKNGTNMAVIDQVLVLMKFIGYVTSLSATRVKCNETRRNYRQRCV